MTSRWITAAAFGMGALMFGALAIGVNRGNIALAQTTNCTTGSAGLSQSEKEMIWEINRIRAQAGLAPLWVSPALNQAAAWKAEDSSNIPPYFTGTIPNITPIPFKGHNDSTGNSPGRSAYQRAIDCGYPIGAAENIAYGSSDPVTVVGWWMGSDGHRANLLGSYQVIGIGGSGGSWVANFGNARDAGSFFLEPPPPPPTSTPTPIPAGNNPPGSGGGGQVVIPTQPPAQPTSVPTATPTAQPTYWNPDALQYPNGPVTPRVRVPMLSRQ